MQLGSINVTTKPLIQSSTIDLISKYSKIVGSALLDGIKKVAVVAKQLFSWLGSQFAVGFAMAKDHFRSNPKIYAAAGIGFGAALALSAIFLRICRRVEGPAASV